jgi:glycosyltransferase involved in cell wall biosynthesis
MKISVLVPSIRPDALPFAIRSVLHQRWADWELLIVAQGAYPALEATVRQAGGGDGRVRCIRLHQMGVSSARNAGLAHASGDIVAMMDDDCEAREDWLAVLAQCFVDHPEVGMVSGALTPPKPKRGRLYMCPTVDPPETLYDPGLTPNKPPEGWKFVTANCAVRRDIALCAGPFDTYLGTGGYFCAGEDPDWGMRLERMHVKMYATPRAVVYHTYGIRYGLRAVIRMSQAYARGNGALAGKLTLMGDPRGREWLCMTRRECIQDTLLELRLHRLPFALNRLRVFEAAYQECVTNFRVDSEDLLQLRQPSMLIK